MACFVISVVEAVAVSVAAKVIEKKEKRKDDVRLRSGVEEKETKTKIPFSRKLKWLDRMLWGGSTLLAFEHVWHGEIVPYFPFLTAASNAEDAAEMLREMATAGVAMAVLVTAVWLGIVGVVSIMEKRASKEEKPAPAPGDAKEA
ncbi:MAG: hypothetical protein IKS34_04480 [Clostridia bacterium]|nr:hypothetical protein [Clostridia bacterium]